MRNLDRFKFRIFDKSRNKMDDQVITAHDVWCDFDTLGNTKEPSWRPFESEFTDCVIMRYTGLRDKNGKLIFEGDILKQICQDDDEYDLMDIGFKDGLFYYRVDPKTKRKKPYPIFFKWGQQWNGSDIEIIGNIYENPELLTNPFD